MEDLTDAALLHGFRGRTLPAGMFRHREHVRAVRLYLRRWGLLGTLDRFPRDLKAFASAHGKPGLYHETITWAYILLVHQRMAECPDDGSWERFARNNVDLLDWADSILCRYYRRERLFGEAARRVFLFPDAAHPVACRQALSPDAEPPSPVPAPPP